MLGIWPALPLIFHANFDKKYVDEDDIIGALEHRDRMAEIYAQGFKCQSTFKKFIASMEEPFPVLTYLSMMGPIDEKMEFMKSVITDPFLGGSAPLLRHLRLNGILFPGLPRLLSSTSDLVYLGLDDFPITGEGHIPPDVMTTCLSILTRLQSLFIAFARQKSSPYPADQPPPPPPPPPTHTVLPALASLNLAGPRGYLEDLLGRVDTPLLNLCELNFHDEPTFDTALVPQFIHNTMFKLPQKVQVEFLKEDVCASSCIGVQL
jgi:hypothetical protein